MRFVDGTREVRRIHDLWQFLWQCARILARSGGSGAVGRGASFLYRRRGVCLSAVSFSASLTKKIKDYGLS